MRRRLFIGLCLGLVYLTTPVSGEITEAVAHFVAHGDAAHRDTSHGTTETQTERGCDGPCHFCGCHGYVSFVPPAAVRRPLAEPPSQLQVMASCSDRMADGFALGVFRPPAA